MPLIHRSARSFIIFFQLGSIAETSIRSWNAGARFRGC
jgi:hypothetical protein